MYIVAIILLAVALLLQCWVGDMPIRLFAMPMNILLLAALLGAIIFTPSAPKNRFSKAFATYGTRQGAIFCLVLLGIGMLLLALLPKHYTTTHWTFSVVILLLLYSLGVVIRRRIVTFRFGKKRRNIAFLITHIGLFLSLAAGWFGAADAYQLHQLSYIGQPSYDAIQEIGTHGDLLSPYTLPFSITTNEFIIEKADGNITAYKAQLQLTDRDSLTTTTTIATNSPAYYRGYHIYLSSFDRQQAEKSTYVVLDITKQPWQWLMLIGIVLLLLGCCIYILND